MATLTIQIRSERHGWLDAALLNFTTPGHVALEYDIDYLTDHFGKKYAQALSLVFPVDAKPYQGPTPGFVLDLIPQGEPLKRLLARYRVQSEGNYEEILSRVPLASPGNLRIKEAWMEADRQREGYAHPGFKLQDVVKHKTEFLTYMEQHGVPIGGTSGAGGGSPKFLLRQDDADNYHADGMLEDSKTKRLLLIKFPYTDSTNSLLLAKTEKAYYDIVRELPLIAGDKIDIHDHILFITRFDRVKVRGKILYRGLESFYSAHNISVYGAPLTHEENLGLISKYSSAVEVDAIEYLKRDILNKVLANTDNHGRNTSFLKTEDSLRLAPLYDITAMKFFTGDFILPLTRWNPENSRIVAQVAWIAENLGIPQKIITKSLKKLATALNNLEEKMNAYGVPLEFIAASRQERQDTLKELQSLHL